MGETKKKNDKGKDKKGKKNKEKKVATPKKTPKGKKAKKSKTDYENEIIKLNRKLAETIVNVGPIEEKLIQWEDKYDEKEQDLEDVKDYLKAERENQEREIEDYENSIKLLDKATQEQKNYYEEKMRSMEEEAQKTIKVLEEELYNANVTRTILSSHQDQMFEYKREEEKFLQEQETLERIQQEEIYIIEKENLRELDKYMKKFEGIMDKISVIIEKEMEINFRVHEGKFNDNKLVCKTSALGKQYEQSIYRLEELKQKEMEAKLGLEIAQEQVRIKEKRLYMCHTAIGLKLEEESEDSTTADIPFYADQEQQTDKVLEENNVATEKDCVNNLWETIRTVENLAQEALDTDIVEEKSTVYEGSVCSEDEIDPLEDQFKRREAIMENIYEIVDHTLEAAYGETSEYRKMIRYVPFAGYKKEKLCVQKSHLPRNDLWRNWKLPTHLKTRSTKREIPIPLPELADQILE